jgi:ABC-type Na+ efflux pump permease subunit
LEGATPPPAGFWEEVKDAVSVRTFVLVLGVLVVQLAFILSYVGAFHRQTPHQISLAVVAPAQISGKLVDELNAIKGEPLVAHSAVDEATARRQLETGKTSAVLVINPAGTTDSASPTGRGRTTASEP